MAQQIQIRRGTSAQWTASVKVPALGEPCLDTTNWTLKLGNGVDLFDDLPEITWTDASNLNIPDLTEQTATDSPSSLDLMIWYDIGSGETKKIKPGELAPLLARYWDAGFSYVWTTGGGAPPGNGYFTTDTNNPATMTVLNVHVQKSNSQDVGDFFALLSVDDVIIGRQFDNGVEELIMVITSVTDNTTYFTFGVNPISGSDLLSNGQAFDFSFSFVSGGPVSSEFEDGSHRIKNTADNTKKLAHDVSGVTTATTRTLKVRDHDMEVRPSGSLMWKYNSTDTDGSTLASGEFSLDAVPGSSAEMFIKDTDLDGVDIGSWMADVFRHGSSNRMILRCVNDPTKTLVVTGVASSDDTGFNRLTFTLTSSSGTWANGDIFTLTMIASTDQIIADHGGLSGLSDDDHVQYILGAGRSLGQTIKGGVASSENLTLESTSHATKGKIVVKDKVEVQSQSYADGEVDGGNSGTSTTTNWTSGNFQKLTLTGNLATWTFTAPSGPTTLILKLIQDGTGSRTVTWPSSVKWAGGTAPTLTTTASAYDVVFFYFDGTNYIGSVITNPS